MTAIVLATLKKDCYQQLQNTLPLGDYLGETSLNKGLLSYALFEKGYGIFYEELLLEAGFKSPFTLEDEGYYFGPENYFIKTKNGFLNPLTKEILQLSLMERLIMMFKEKLKWQGELFSKRKQLPETALRQLPFIGVPEELFAPYADIITKKGNLCGTYASGVLFSYLQDQQQLLIPSTLRRPFESSYDKLIQAIERKVQPIDLPTVPLEIVIGWKLFFWYYHIPNKIYFKNFGGKKELIQQLTNHQPALLGILRILGSSYGNHWVVAYSYCHYQGATYYKIHDNWGDYRKIIHASLGNGWVTIKNRTL